LRAWRRSGEGWGARFGKGGERTGRRRAGGIRPGAVLRGEDRCRKRNRERPGRDRCRGERHGGTRSLGLAGRGERDIGCAGGERRAARRLGRGPAGGGRLHRGREQQHGRDQADRVQLAQERGEAAWHGP